MRTAPKLTEKAFMAQVVKLARLCGWLCYHTYDARRSEPGFPDLVLVHRRRQMHLFVELKVGKNKMTPEQMEWFCALIAAGADARIWHPEHWPDIERILTGRTS